MYLFKNKNDHNIVQIAEMNRHRINKKPYIVILYRAIVICSIL